ncbi:prephenate dehydratase [Evansella clarkii]|jgi:prephenate dehydratase|uniref:prephenate dehydratase n=1 Tax=Evansella clarkii TaxID=79879 RepID=UPI000997D974|nr:prephenate dehydratase [Evansella clarkii]
MKKVGFLGPKGSFTEAAAKEMFFGSERIPFSNIPDSIDAVKEKKVDYTVVPLENAIEGSVNITLDYLIHHQRLEIGAEIIEPIQQNLLVRPENMSSLESISEVYSHPHAIAQCRNFLRERLPGAEIIYTNSTAEAAQYVSAQQGKNIAAVANFTAAEEYGLEPAVNEINDYNNNSTRFVVLYDRAFKGNEINIENDYPVSGYKTTMMVTLPSDYSGALHQVLSAFAWRKINLSKIESRPMKTGLGNYFFIIDADMQMDQVLLPGVFEEIKALGCGVEILGSYPCLNWASAVDKKKAVK